MFRNIAYRRTLKLERLLKDEGLIKSLSIDFKNDSNSYYTFESAEYIGSLKCSITGKVDKDNLYWLKVYVIDSSEEEEHLLTISEIKASTFKSAEKFLLDIKTKYF